MLLANKWSHLRLAAHRIAEADFRHHLFHPSDKFLEEILLNENAGAGGTDFALIDENAEEGAVGCGFKIRVRKKDVWRFAAKL